MVADYDASILTTTMNLYSANYIFSFPSPKITADEIFISTACFSPKIYPAFAFTSYFVKEKNEAFLVPFKDISII